MKTATNLLPRLTPTQAMLLRAAARRADGRVIPPDNLRGGARANTLTGLRQRGWIEPTADGDALTDAGYAAIGRQRPAPADAIQNLDTVGDLQLLEGIPVRPGTKLAALVVALRRQQGATTLQLMAATGWQPHTVRGAISGLLRKRLDLNVELTRNAAGERLVPNYTVKNGKTYRYYTPIKHRRFGAWASQHGPLPAEPVEDLVVEQIVAALSAPHIVQAVWDRVQELSPQMSEPEVALPMRRLATMWRQLFPVEQCRLAQLLIERVVIADGGLEIVWRDQGWQALAGELMPGSLGAELRELEESV